MKRRLSISESQERELLLKRAMPTDALSLVGNWSRRDFLKTASAAMLSTLAAGFPRQLTFASESEAPKPTPTADAVILLWMAGGMAHTETFDPKVRTRLKPHLKAIDLLSTFHSIPTSVDGLQLSEGMENIAKVMDRATLVRSFLPPDLGHILHSRHQFHWHTGYVPPQSIEVPHIGSMISRTLGSRNKDVPAFIHIGQRLDIDGADEVRAFLTAGFLGSEYGPMLIVDPERAVDTISPPLGMTRARFQNRMELYRKLLKESPIGEFGSDFQRESFMRSMDNADRLLNSPSAKAFDLSTEPEEIRARYNTGRFGNGCLLARKLVEAGARFVEVTSEHIPFGNWDTHFNGHRRTVDMKKWVDAPIAQLILDLEQRGMLDRTLVVIASEFSRSTFKDPEKDQSNSSEKIVHLRQYGLHRHFTKAGSVVFFGGGMKRGSVYGRTADEFPCHTTENPTNLQDLHATIYRALGIPANLSYEIERRPFYVTQDGLGKPIPELFAKAI